MQLLTISWPSLIYPRQIQSDTNFAIVKADDIDRKPITLKLFLSAYSRDLIRSASQGDLIFPTEVLGEWIDDPKYGRQFQGYTLMIPETQAMRNLVNLASIPSTKKNQISNLLEQYLSEGSTELESLRNALNEIYSSVNAKRHFNNIYKHRLWPHILATLVEKQIPSKAIGNIENFFSDNVQQAIKAMTDDPYQLVLDDVIDFKTANIFEGLSAKDNAHIQSLKQKAAVYESLNKLSRATCSTCHSQQAVLKAASTLCPITKIEESDYYTFVSDGYDSHRMMQSSLHARVEGNIAKHIQRLSDSPKSIDFDGKALAHTFAKRGETPTDCQRRSFDILHTPLNVVSGLPGTGKTKLVNILIETIDSVCPCEILLLAPTGAAAKRMEEMTNKPASTIHRALKYNPGTGQFEFDETNPLDVDWVILDEASMTDMFLFNSLVKALPDNARLTCLGDIDQLASIQEGSVLRDLKETLPSIRMTSSKRFSEDGIVTFCHNLSKGKVDLSLKANDLQIGIVDGEQAIQQAIFKTIKAILNKGNAAGIFNIQIISPKYAGPAGIDAINEHCRQLIFGDKPGLEIYSKGKQFKFHVGHKVIYKQNNYEKELFNGDIGVISSFQAKPSDDHLLTIKIKNRFIPLSRLESKSLLPAYCISAHNTQGNEYDFVMVALTRDAKKLLTRNLVNTAVSRGKKRVVLVAERGVLELAAQNTESERITGLAPKIHEALDAGVLSNAI